MSQILVTGEAKIRDIQGPVVANSGVITALDGDASQYVRGDGTLADFPTSTGGGSSVSYYLNSSVSQGTIGGVAYRQLSKTPISGAGTDITASTNGYIASYLTDANDPALLEVPAGNFNCEFYFSVNSNNHNPYVYAELYKYDGTTFTLLGSSQSIPEYLTNGTTLSAYYFAIPVAVAALTITDRLAIRIYVNVDGRVVTLHTENNHLCQVVTTFSKGLTSLNNLTRQVQFLGTGTSGTDFNISSATATHTFNLPVASAANTGKLSSTDWSTFNNKQPAGNYVTLDTTQTITAAKTFTGVVSSIADTNAAAYILQGRTSDDLAQIQYKNNAGSNTKAIINFSSVGTNGGGIQFLVKPQDLPIVSSLSLSSNQADFETSVTSTGIFRGTTLGILNSTFTSTIGASLTANRTITIPDASGTLALTSNLSAYVPYTGATGNVTLGTNTLTASTLIVDQGSTGTTLRFKQYGSASYNTNGYTDIYAVSNNIVGFGLNQGSGNFKGFTFNVVNVTSNQSRDLYIPDATGTIALLSGTQTFTGATTFSNDIIINGVRVGKGASSVAGNTVVGEDALISNTGAGTGNTAIGYASLNANTSGGANTGIGNQALVRVTTGSYNIGVGFFAGENITTGNNNTIIGNYAGTAGMVNNIVLADGAGNIRYQWNGTNNVFGNPISGTSATFSGALTVNGLINNTYSDNAYLGITIRNTNTGNAALSGFSIQNSGGTTVGQVNYVSTVYANTTLRNTLLINTVFDNKLAFATNSSGGATRADIYFTVNPAFALDTANPNQIHILGTSRNVAINYSGTDYGANFQVNGTTRLSDALTGTSAIFSQTTSNKLTLSGGSTQNGLTLEAVSGFGNSFYIFNGNGGLGNGFGIYNITTSTLPFYISNAGAATFSSSVTATSGTFNGTLITSVGNGLIIGGTGFAFAPSSTRGALQIVGSTDRLISFGTNGSQDAYIYSAASITQIVSTPDISFVVSSERMRITSGGNVGIGTSSTGFNAAGLPLVVGGGSGNTGLTIFSGASSAGSIHFADTETTGAGSYAGYIYYNHTNNFMQIGTNAADSLRITSGGNVLIGNSVDNSYKLGVDSGSGSNLIWLTRATGANSQIFMGGANAAGTQLYVTSNNSGGVYLAAGGVAWIAASDERLKTDLVDIEDAANKISSLRSVIGRYKTDKEGTKRAFLIAQDVLKVLPEAVNENLETGDLGVSYTEVIPLLVAAIKELKLEIEQLKNK